MFVELSRAWAWLSRSTMCFLQQSIVSWKNIFVGIICCWWVFLFVVLLFHCSQMDLNTTPSMKKKLKIEKLKNKCLSLFLYCLNLIHLDEAECELNCKPIGMNYFALLQDRVIDGTSCLFPVDFVQQNHSGRAMCVDGICKVSYISIFLARGRCVLLLCRPLSRIEFRDGAIRPPKFFAFKTDQAQKVHVHIA